MSKEDISY